MKALPPGLITPDGLAAHTAPAAQAEGGWAQVRMAAPAQSLCSLGQGGPSLFPRGAGHDGVAERPGGGVTHHHLRSPPPQQVHQGGREANAARTPGPPAPGATPNSAVGSATRFLLGGRRRLRVEMVRGEGGLRAQRKLREGHRPQKSPRCPPSPGRGHAEGLAAVGTPGCTQLQASMGPAPGTQAWSWREGAQ